MPWLFYADGSADDVLTDLEITTEFTPGMHLTFTASKYTLEGSLVSYDVITAGGGGGGATKVNSCTETISFL